MTPRQAQVLQVLHDRLSTDGVCPSYRELAAAAGVHLSRIYFVVSQLERRGYVRRKPGAHRAIEVLRPPLGQLSADEVAWCHAHADAVRRLQATMAPGGAG